MKNILLATYERSSTLWKNANLFYKMQDWIKMECFFSDWSEERSTEFTIRDANGNDVTNEYTADKYIVRLSSSKTSKDYTFTDRSNANEFVKNILNHKILVGWHKVS